MKARYQVTLPSVHLTHEQPLYDIAIYLENKGEEIFLQELEHGVENLYKVLPPFFLKGSRSKAGQCLSFRPMKWGAKKYLIPGVQLFAVLSPNRIFLFSDQPLRSDREILDLITRDPEFYEEDEYEPSDDERESQTSDYQEYLDDQDYEENPPGSMPPAIQWGMWLLHTAGMLMNPPPRITEELVGHHHGQNDLILNAYGPESNQLLGYISYSEFPAGSNKIQVNWIYVENKSRRQGIGTLLVLALQDKYKKINWGFTTPEGTGLLKKIEKLKSQKMAFLPGGKPNRRAEKNGKISEVVKAVMLSSHLDKVDRRGGPSISAPSIIICECCGKRIKEGSNICMRVTKKRMAYRHPYCKDLRKRGGQGWIGKLTRSED